MYYYLDKGLEYNMDIDLNRCHDNHHLKGILHTSCDAYCFSGLIIHCSTLRTFNICSLVQFVICKRKLESKKEALLILSKELDTCQQERDQYKLMANQLRERHQGLKKKYRELIVRHLNCHLWAPGSKMSIVH